MSTTADIRNRCECHDCTQARAHPLVFFDAGTVDLGRVSPSDLAIARLMIGKKSPANITEDDIQQEMGDDYRPPQDPRQPGQQEDTVFMEGVTQMQAEYIIAQSSGTAGIWTVIREIRTAAIAAERERCAKIAISFMISSEFARNQLLGNVAAAIREGQ